jgi:hypothetical protein
MGLHQLLRSGRVLSAATRSLVPASSVWEAAACSRSLASLPEPISDSGPVNTKDGKVPPRVSRRICQCSVFLQYK